MDRLSLPLLCLGITLALGLLEAAPAPLERTLILPDETPKPGTQFAILITGDGGWAELDRRLAQGLTRADVPVVGWDSRAYYWTRRTPEGAASDLARLIRRFGQEWRRPQVLLIGYSRGADVLPFLVNRLPEAARAALRLVALLGPGRTIDFEFHLADYVRDSKAATALPVPPEILKLRGQPLLIVYGEDDDSSCAPQLPKDIGHIECLPGDHHFARAYGRLAEVILRSARGAPSPAVAHPEDSMKP